MGARYNSMPKRNLKSNNFQCKSNDIRESASLFENNKEEDKTNRNETKHNVCSCTIREKLYSKYLESQNAMKQSSAQIQQGIQENTESDRLVTWYMGSGISPQSVGIEDQV